MKCMWINIIILISINAILILFTGLGIAGIYTSIETECNVIECGNLTNPTGVELLLELIKYDSSVDKVYDMQTIGDFIEYSECNAVPLTHSCYYDARSHTIASYRVPEFLFIIMIGPFIIFNIMYIMGMIRWSCD